MIKSIGKLSLAGILAALILGVPVRVSAQAQEPAPASPAPAPAKPKAIPFKGKLAAVDKAAMTITVSKRTFSITSETKLFKDGKSCHAGRRSCGRARYRQLFQGR